ncbi:MAG: hypothetical protein JWO43_605 [Candidatus Adlerbacteria bacterium]|nr:hypothetical protein [Candidatus Adlerbacteria bacterium]
MNKQAGFISIGLLLAIILGVAVVGGGSYYVMQKMSVPQPEVVAQNEADSQQTTQTSPNGVTINSLTSAVGNPTLTGKAGTISKASDLYISVYGQDGKVWGSGNADPVITNGRWSIQVGAPDSTFKLSPGSYTVYVGDPRAPLAQGTLTITSPESTSTTKTQENVTAAPTINVTGFKAEGPATITVSYANLPKRTSAFAVCTDSNTCTDWVENFVPPSPTGTYTMSVQHGYAQSQKGLSAGKYKIVVIGSEFSDHIVSSGTFIVP